MKAVQVRAVHLFSLYRYIKDDFMKNKILVIEDSKNIIFLIKKYLDKHGFQVFTASDGVEAMVKVYDVIPDLILLDIVIPKLSGYLVCKALKEDDRVSNIPIIAMSAKTQEEDIQRALEAGALDYITKPFTPETLLQKINKFINIT